VVRKRGKLGFDMDGVLYPWHEMVVEDMIVKGHVPKGTTVGGFFNYPEGIMHRFSIDMQQSLVKNAIYYIRPFLRDNAKQILDHLQIEWEIFYLTSRPHEVESATKAWIRRMGLPNKENVYVLNGGKRDMAKLLGLDIFVEDRITHVDELHDICPVILVTRPWNKDYNIQNHVRIDHLHELIPLLEGGLDANRD